MSISNALGRVRRHREAQKHLAEIYDRRQKVIVIHYSCESFYNRREETSPRIASIAVRNLATAQTESFSIHQLAERKRKLDDMKAHYDEFEQQMLKEFFEYAKDRLDYTWLHWNMRDSNYGFAALEHRFQVHGGQPVEIPDVCRRDLSLLLLQLYGVNYIGRPRLESLVRKNGISGRDFLNGKEEAKAFVDGRYVDLHRSTLRKVDVISDIANRAADGTLKTDASPTEIYGSSLAFAVAKAKEHWIISLLGILGAIASVVSLFR